MGKTDPIQARILVVDDEPANVRLLERMLAEGGYRQVKSTTDSRQVLALAGEFQPDLILLDLMLPGELSGSQVLERIRAENGSEPKVLVVSALVNPTTAPKLEAYGNVETLGKPFKIKELAARIQAMLDA
jgi:putative two-component system response regulator